MHSETKLQHHDINLEKKRFNDGLTKKCKKLLTQGGTGFYRYQYRYEILKLPIKKLRFFLTRGTLDINRFPRFGGFCYEPPSNLHACVWQHTP
jgi:hypothetical protein